MKRIVPSALVLIALAVGAFVFFQHEQPHRPRGAEIAPPETLLFLHLPDLRRSARRWPETALAQLWREPELRSFLAQPLERMPLLVQVRQTLERLQRVAPREAFVAFTALDGASPKFVAGFAFAGGKWAAQAAVAEPWAAWQRAWPGGRVDLVNHAGCEIETYTDRAQVVAQSLHAGWYLVANDLDALKAALERCDGRSGSGLAGTEAFPRSTAALPAELDAVLFAQLGGVQQRLARMLPEAGSPPGAPAAEEARRTLAWGTRFEGAQMRDTIFLAGTGESGAPLARETLALGGAATVLEVTLALPARIEWPESVSTVLGLLTPAFATLQSELAKKQVTWAAFGAAFGPELGVTLDWPEEADAPSTAVALAVRDAAQARRFIEGLTSPALDGRHWQREEIAGATLYEAPPEQSARAASSVALTERFAVLGGNADVVRASLVRLRAGTGAAIASPAPLGLRAPTAAYGTLDLRVLFERTYGMLRPFLAMSLAFSEEAGQYFDASKLPSSAALSRHLGPSVYAQAATADGTIIESVGPLTFSQTLAGVLAGAWTSALPALRQLGKKETAATVEPAVAAPPSPPFPTAPAETSAKPGANVESSQKQGSQP